MSEKGHHHPEEEKQESVYNEEAQFEEEPQFQEENNEKKPDAPPPADAYPPPSEEKHKLKRVESGEEIVRPRNVASSPNDKRNSGIVIRIKSLEQVGYLPAKVLIEIRNETNLVGEEGGPSTRQTKLVPKHTPTWDEDFYYNNNVVLDDNITFILRAENMREEARTEVRNLSLQRKGDGEDSRVEILELQLKKEDLIIAKLFIEISFYEREDILGGVLMPNLSLRPPPNFKAQYNAIDSYNPAFSKRTGSKANCFNFYDGDLLPGFQNMEVFPPKIQRRNKKVIEAE